ncbi:hypothetical protein GUJ93_ZPchr0005g14362 [Zizania palustris]|uniref:Secreted protein n=1 Tax=Zizania palustris TaxID=103762 RepID=A0A8J5T9N6_ZIZPA|nr:hypothetical protein GUJ93_ZPchr0005g14362 [Zizania palustris]
MHPISLGLNSFVSFVFLAQSLLQVDNLLLGFQGPLMEATLHVLGHLLLKACQVPPKGVKALRKGILVSW